MRLKLCLTGLKETQILIFKQNKNKEKEEEEKEEKKTMKKPDSSWSVAAHNPPSVYSFPGITTKPTAIQHNIGIAYDDTDVVNKLVQKENLHSVFEPSFAANKKEIKRVEDYITPGCVKCKHCGAHVPKAFNEKFKRKPFCSVCLKDL